MKIKIRRLWAALTAAFVVLSLCGCTFLMAPKEKDDGLTEEERAEMSRIESALAQIGYATEGVTVVEDPNALSEEVRRLNEAAQEQGIGVEYKNQAFSLDGQNFDCYIGNPVDSGYDMFIDIYTSDLQEELYLSQLLRPGQAFEKITLNRPLTEDTRLNVVYTQVQVNEESGELEIRAQTIITLDFVILHPGADDSYDS